MCELFAVNSAEPITVPYLLIDLAKRGGLTHLNNSGWGISFYQTRDALLFKEAAAAFSSPAIGLISSQKIESTCIMAHIRRATSGNISFENTHPFRRELGGRAHIFAHNGDFHDFQSDLPLTADGFRPIGQTDSEHAFCYLLNQLKPLWRKSEPDLEDRLAAVSEFADQVRTGKNMANFIYFDGDYLFAHADRREFDIDGKMTEPRSPALFLADRKKLFKNDWRVIAPFQETEALMLFSVPIAPSLHPLDRGTLLVIKDGMVLTQKQL
jgi:glutamine amidotransferase